MEYADEDVDDFEVRLGTYDVVIWVEIPHFSSPEECNCKENCNGVIKNGKGQPEYSFRIFSLFVQIAFYSNGCPYHDSPDENEGYISTLFDIIFYNSDLIYGARAISLNGTLTVVDVDSKSKYPQTLGGKCDLYQEIEDKGVVDYQIGFPKFMKRKDLLKNSKRFLPNDTLTIRCDIKFQIEGVVDKISFWSEELFHEKDSEEEWFLHEAIHDEKTGESHVKHSLILSDPDKPLCKQLRLKSAYFRSLFCTSFKEGITQLLSIEDEEYKAFYNMVCYVRFNSLDHIHNIEECTELYVIADKYNVEGLIESCHQYMRRNIKSENAADLLMFCDLYKDRKMKEFIVEYILSNWYAVKLSDAWKVLEEERRDLIREIIYMSEENDSLLTRDTECLKSFREEMECYGVYPRYRRTKRSSECSMGDKCEAVSKSDNVCPQPTELKEKWFLLEYKHNDNTGEEFIKYSLNLSDKDSLFCQQLREQSPYFQSLLALEGKIESLPIKEEEYHTFYNIICYVRFHTLDHICTLEECRDLYVVANKYDMVALAEDCCNYMKNKMKHDTAADVLIFSDNFQEVKLKNITIKYILTNWFKVCKTDSWKFIEEERQDLVRDMFLFIEKDDSNFKPEDNECLEAFKKEMKCYGTLLKDSFTQDISMKELAFFDLLTVGNQEIVIGFLLAKAYAGYEHEKNLGYFEYKNFIYIKQEDLVREMMRFIKRDFPKYFLTRKDCFQIFRTTMQELGEELEKHRVTFATPVNFFESYDVSMDQKQHCFVQCILKKWFDITFSDDWKCMRATEEDEAETELKEDEEMEALYSAFNKNIALNKPILPLDELDFDYIFSCKCQTILIEFLLAYWNEEISYEFLKIAMNARLNLYRQSLFVYEKEEKLKSTNEDIALKFEDRREHIENFNFYQ